MKRQSTAALATVDEQQPWGMPDGILQAEHQTSVPHPEPKFVLAVWLIMAVPMTAIAVAIGWQSRWSWPGYLILWGILVLVAGLLVVLVVSGLWPSTLSTWLLHRRQQNWIDEAADIERLKIKASVLVERERTKRYSLESWSRNQDLEHAQVVISADTQRNEKLASQLPDPGKIELIRFLSECYRRNPDGSYANVLPDGRLRIGCPLSTSRNAKYQWRGEVRERAEHWLKVLETSSGTWVLKPENHGWFLNIEDLPTITKLLPLINGKADA